jgi:hypothetical protein
MEGFFQNVHLKM